MGFWGGLVLCRSEAPLLEVSALMERSEGLESDQCLAGGWRLGCFPDGTELSGDVPGMLAELSVETGAAALVGFVLDSDAVVVEGYSTGGGHWRACLARESMADICEDDEVDFDAEYPSAEQAVDLVTRWAQDAGLTPDPARLLPLFQADEADPLAETLFYEMLDPLGIRPPTTTS